MPLMRGETGVGWGRPPAVGVVARHRRGCALRQGGVGCSCSPSFQAQVWSPRDRRHARKTFAELGDAKAWRQEMQVAVRQGRAGAPSTVTLADAAREWLALAEGGVVRTRSGDRYKPSALRGYAGALRAVTTELGHLRLSADHAATICRTSSTDSSPRGGRRAPSATRSCRCERSDRRAVSREQVLRPTRRSKLLLPAVRGTPRPDRCARARRPLSSLAAPTTRPGDLGDRASTPASASASCAPSICPDVDLERRPHPGSSTRWDAKAGLIEPKSRSGRRRVPLTSTLRAAILLVPRGSVRVTAARGWPSPRRRTGPFHRWRCAARRARVGVEAKAGLGPDPTSTNAATPTPPT